MAAPLPAPPAGLKTLAPYLQRANELAKADRVMSYWSLYYATQQGVALPIRDKESNTFLFTLMDRLEELKANLANNDAATSDEPGSAYVENVALKVFTGADDEDRSGRADRNTARKFLVASNFFDILTVFGALGDENAEKRTYAKWKAADISRAIKEGRKPAPGPPGWDPEEEKRQRAAEMAAEREASQALAEAKDDDDLLAREIARLTTPSGPVGGTPGPQAGDDIEASGRPSATAGSSDGEGASFGHAISTPPGNDHSTALPQERKAPTRVSIDAASALTTLPSTPSKQTQGGDFASPPISSPGNSPNFSHPLRPQLQRAMSSSSHRNSDGGSAAQESRVSGIAPSAPDASYFRQAGPSPGGTAAAAQKSPSLKLTVTPGEVTAPGRPLPLTPQQLQEGEVRDPLASASSPAQQQQQHQQQPPVPLQHSAPGPTAQVPSAPSVAPSTALQLQFPSAPPAPAAVARTTTTTTTSPPAPTDALPEVLSPQLTGKAQRLAKFAISALDYDDLETARRQLREALDIVEGRTIK